MSQMYGVMSATENRDLSRAAAERHFLIQASSEGPVATTKRSRLSWARLRTAVSAPRPRA